MHAALPLPTNAASAHTTQVEHPESLHMRPCAAIVDHLESLDATVEFIGAEQRADGRNLLDLLCMAAGSEAPLLVRASGRDAAAAIDGIRTILSCG